MSFSWIKKKKLKLLNKWKKQIDLIKNKEKKVKVEKNNVNESNTRLLLCWIFYVVG